MSGSKARPGNRGPEVPVAEPPALPVRCRVCQVTVGHVILIGVPPGPVVGGGQPVRGRHPDPEQSAGAGTGQVTVQAGFQRGSPVSEDVVRHAGPRLHVVPLQRRRFRERDVPIRRERPGADALFGEDQLQVVVAEADVDGQPAHRPPFLREHRVLVAVDQVVVRQIEERDPVRHGVPESIPQGRIGDTERALLRPPADVEPHPQGMGPRDVRHDHARLIRDVV